MNKTFSKTMSGEDAEELMKELDAKSKTRDCKKGGLVQITVTATPVPELVIRLFHLGDGCYDVALDGGQTWHCDDLKQALTCALYKRWPDDDDKREICLQLLKVLDPTTTRLGS